MEQEVSEKKELRMEIVKVKDHNGRKFKLFVNNFYVLKAALRYFSVRQGMSFTSSKVAENFPLPTAVAGSGLNVLEKLGVIEKRTESSSPDRYMPDKVDMERLLRIEEILEESHEIESFS